MSSINVLDQNTINQIAAGEVIERPSSVVKELVENAMDAGATAITVEIRDGGTTLIRVTDNGSGITPEDIPLAFLQHATSKIKSAEDLLTVSSLGFRGEALSSIASVAQVEVITKTKENLTGVRYRIEGGQELGKEEIGAPDGTTFLVRNLFFNTPARRKFLKSASTEGSYISSLMERMALSHPDISFRLIIGNQTRLQTSGNHHLKDIIYTIFGKEIAGALMPIHIESENIKVEGFACKPEVSRGNRTYENYFINGRYVKSAMITKAIENAYHGFVMQHKYPFAVLHMTIPSSFLDVNVHPTKMELRFRNEEEVYETVWKGIRSELTGKELIPSNSFSDDDSLNGNILSREKQENKRENTRKDSNQVSISNQSFQKSQNKSERGPEPFETRRRHLSALRETVKYEPSTIELMQKNLTGSSSWNSSVSNETRPSMEESQERLKAAEFTAKPDFKEKENSFVSSEDSIVSKEKRVSADKTESALLDPVISIMGKDKPDKKEDTFQETPSFREKETAMEIENPQQMNLFEEKLLSSQARDEYHLIGQLFDTYWLIQYRDQLMIMDQHAAHEKVLFEKTMKDMKNRELLSQQVQPPIILTLSDREIQVVEEYRENLEHLGFQLEPFGGKEYAVHGVPSNLFNIARQDLLIECIDTLADDSAHTQMTLIEEKIALMSCKAAVKGNHRLSREEAWALLDSLLELENPYMCPHGRPTIITMTQYELEKKFKRVVS
ncbi:MAG: DNA mismatch repair endonuclease MutL [Clostridiales bacterium]|nr:DNA mismatch repair endonuclease MutL [Clostridiales bacterium]